MAKDFRKLFFVGILSFVLLGISGRVTEGSNKKRKNIIGEELLNYYVLREDDTDKLETVADNLIVLPTAPTDLMATALTYDRIDIVWQDNSDNEMAFNIERREETAETFSNLTVVEAIIGSGSNGFYEDTGLLPDTTYCYRIQAYNLEGNSPYSSESCATTKHKPVTTPTVVTGSAVNVDFNSATLVGKVNPNGLTTGVFFQWGPETAAFENMTPLKSAGNGETDVDIRAELTGLFLDTTYYYRMVAVTRKGGAVLGSQKSFTTHKLPERLNNGSFSSGTKGWNFVNDFWAGTNFTKYHSQPGYAAGGVGRNGVSKNNARGSMYQIVTIPSSATTATLSFWLNVTSKESTAEQRDKLYVEVLDSKGGFLQELASYSNLDKTSKVIYSRKYLDLTNYKGREIRIQFRSITDRTSSTVFRIDDVSLMSDD